ncbi:MAG: inorganic diphosphatase [Rhodospirillaceae bacterium]|nr:inorganic diphosphatase [Rhodospirillaceae bacterium]
MTDYSRLPTRNAKGAVYVVVETSKGMGAKCKFDPELNGFSYGRPLPAGVTYPFDWGFIPSTCGADGDALDALVLHSAACTPGTIIPCKVVAVLDVSQTENGATFRNDRYILRPFTAAGVDDVKLTKTLKAKLEQFFLDAVKLTPKKLKFLGWRTSAEALRRINASHKAWLKLQKK